MHNQGIEQIYRHLQEKLSGMLLEEELRHKAALAWQINQLKAQKNAVILGHNYMEPALFHSIPDFKGDSLDLSRKAAQTEAEMIVFCGVRFMAETAKILSPSRTVLIPSLEAGCSLAESITAADVRALRQRYPGVPVVAYVNTYADVKAEVDICCTSSNAAAVVESLHADTIIFLPDEYLARNVARQTGRHIIFPSLEGGEDSEIDRQPVGKGRMIGWRGRCEVHEKFTVQDVQQVRTQYPQAAVLVHPESSPDVVEACDFTGSTNAMISYVEQSNAPQYLILTECAMSDNIAAANPHKQILRLCRERCPHMGLITLENTLQALQQNQYVIEVPEAIRQRAVRSVERMITIG